MVTVRSCFALTGFPLESNNTTEKYPFFGPSSEKVSGITLTSNFFSFCKES